MLMISVALSPIACTPSTFNVCGQKSIFSMPVWSWLKTTLACLNAKLPEKPQAVLVQVGAYAELLLIVLLLVVSSAWMAGNTHNPFIYYRF